jgi:hypothetical protein
MTSEESKTTKQCKSVKQMDNKHSYMEFQNDFHNQFRNFGHYAQEPLEFTKS